MRIVLTALLLGMPFFFYGGPGAHGSRSFVALWDLGHVLFFSLASLWLFKYFQNRFPDRSFPAVFINVFLIVLVLGLSVEGLQACSDDRLPDLMDILRNQLGCLITVVFLYPRKGYKKNVFRCVVLVFISIALIPLVRGGVDEWGSRNQFPVLSDFETAYEFDRWKSNGRMRIEKGIAIHGNQALRVQLTTDQYSGVSLDFFQGDWSGFSRLSFSVYLPEDEPLEMICRIHDSAHANRYNDRFNKKFLLKKGWNEIKVSLEDVANAPLDRLLNLAEVEKFKIFVIEQERARVVYLDFVYLE